MTHREMHRMTSAVPQAATIVVRMKCETPKTGSSTAKSHHIASTVLDFDVVLACWES